MTNRKVKNPPKEGTVSKEVAKAAVKTASAKQPKPTIKSLQEQLANSEAQRVLTDNLANTLEDIIAMRDKTITELKLQLNAKDVHLEELKAEVYKLQTRSLFAELLYRLSRPFK